MTKLTAGQGAIIGGCPCVPHSDHAHVPKVMKSETFCALVGFTAVKILRARINRHQQLFPSHDSQCPFKARDHLRSAIVHDLFASPAQPRISSFQSTVKVPKKMQRTALMPLQPTHGGRPTASVQRWFLERKGKTKRLTRVVGRA